MGDALDEQLERARELGFLGPGPIRPHRDHALAFLTAIALQVRPQDKQRLLALPGVPEILDMENYLLARELQLLQYMVDTQAVVEAMSGGPTGYLFPN